MKTRSTLFFGLLLALPSVGIWPATAQPQSPVLCLEGHKKPVCALTFSQDGRHLLSGDFDDVRLWDVNTGKELRCFPAPTNYLNTLAFINGAKVGLAVTHNRTLRFWDLYSGKEGYNEKVISGFGSSVAVSSDGLSLAVCASRKIAVWNAASLNMRHEWPTLLHGVDSSAFSRDGTILAVGASMIGDYEAMGALIVGSKPGERIIQCWRIATGEALPRIGNQSNEVQQLAVSPDGRTLAAVPKHGQVDLWETTTGKPRGSFEPGDGVTSLQFSPNGRFLAMANAYAYGQYYFGGKWTGKFVDRIRLYDLASGGEVVPLGKHKGPIASIAFSPDGKWLASGSHDTTVLIWDISSVYQAPAPPGSEDVDALWKDLTGADGGEAYRAMWSFGAIPKQAVPYLAKRVEPVPEADAKLLERLLTELNSDQFVVRQKANRELEKLGALAKPALQRALTKDASEEFRRRAEQLLKLPPEPIGTAHLRIIEVLERIGNAEARQHLRRLASGAAGARVTEEAQASVDRLDRQFGRVDNR